MTKPVIQLTACNYSDIGRNTPVLNKQQLDYYMYVYISPDVDRLATLVDVTEITGTYSAPALEGAFDKDSPCWIKVTTGLINYLTKNYLTIFIYYLRYIILIQITKY